MRPFGAKVSVSPLWPKFSKISLTETLEIRTFRLAYSLEVKYNNKEQLSELRTRFIFNLRQSLDFRRSVFGGICTP